MKKRILALVCALMLCALPALAIPDAPEDVYVLDAADVLTAQTEEYIIHNNTLLDDACGAQIVIVTVDSTGGEAIDDYANDIFNSWKIGSSKQDNGLLLVMAIDDDNYYCEPGVGVGKRLSGGAIKLMLDEYLEPDFAAKDYDAGARKLFDAVFAEINDMYSAGVALTEVTGSAYGTTDSALAADPEPVRSSGISMTGVLFILIIIVLAIMLSRATRRNRRANPVQRPTVFSAEPRPGTGPRPQNRSNPPFDTSGSGMPRGGMFGGSRSTRPFGGFGSSRPFGGSRSSRSSGGFGSSRSSGGFGSSRSSGGFGSSRSSGGFGSSRSSGSRPTRSFGGGRSRGGGAGRGR